MTGRRSARLSAQAESKVGGKAVAMPPPPAVKTRKRKTSPAVVADNGEAAQSTPKRRVQKSTVPPPATPTPSAVGLMAEPVDGFMTPTSKSTPRSRAVARLADPKTTNATLLSPQTSRIVASKPLDDISPSKTPAIKTTTDNILEEACAHLIKVNARMKPLIEAHHCRIFSPEGLAEQIDPFESLASGIISQQVSGAAAKAIKGRFIALFDHDEAADATTTTPSKKFPTPGQVASTSIEELRTAGLSQRKAEYLKGLGEKFASGELTAQMLADAPYEEVLEKLTGVRGLGKWSVEMFACFGLKRMDVFSLGDLGVQRGMAAFVGRDVSKLKAKGGGNKWKYMNETEMAEMAQPFSPYRSVFMWYMWRVEETDVSTLE